MALELILGTHPPSPIVDNLLKSQPQLVPQLLKALHSNHVDNDDEFAALSRSKRGEEDITIKEIKKAVMEAIQILLSKLDLNDTLTGDLFVAYASLNNRKENTRYLYDKKIGLVELLLSAGHLPCQFVDRQLNGLAFLPAIIDIH